MLRALLLDIEGTTTAISFVYDSMFPFARRNLDAYLDTHWGSDDLADIIDALRTQATQDRAEGFSGVPQIPLRGDDVRDAVRANVAWQMDNDRKTTALKALQGRIWKSGFASGQLRGHLFSDVPPVISDLNAQEIPVYIYSSGSVASQKLLFGHSVAGDLTPSLAGYFDTTTGPKKEASSYTSIAATIGLAPREVLFISDNIDELRAAHEAGASTILSVRPGNPPIDNTDLTPHLDDITPPKTLTDFSSVPALFAR